jgi:hypothetical protein
MVGAGATSLLLPISTDDHVFRIDDAALVVTLTGTGFTIPELLCFVLEADLE